MSVRPPSGPGHWASPGLPSIRGGAVQSSPGCPCCRPLLCRLHPEEQVKESTGTHFPFKSKRQREEVREDEKQEHPVSHGCAWPAQVPSTDAPGPRGTKPHGRQALVTPCHSLCTFLLPAQASAAGTGHRRSPALGADTQGAEHTCPAARPTRPPCPSHVGTRKHTRAHGYAIKHTHKPHIHRYSTTHGHTPILNHTRTQTEAHKHFTASLSHVRHCCATTLSVSKNNAHR